MRYRVLTLLLLATACAPAQRWTRPGADNVLIARDTEDCDAVAKQEALRRYPYMAGAGSYGPTGMILSQQQDSTNRASVQATVFRECMQKKGYTRSAGP